MLAKINGSVTVLGIMNVSDMARALGRMGKGKKKTMSEAALAQRRNAAQQRKKKSSHKTMKAILILLFTTAITLGQQVSTQVDPVVNADRVLLLKGRIAGDMKVWLVVEAHNAYQWQTDGYNPCLTRLVCDYKPLFRQLPNKTWEIMFVSPIAEKLP